MSFPKPSWLLSIVGMMAVALGILLIPEASSQETKKPFKAVKRDFRATTADGVRLVGDFYPPEGKNAKTPKDTKCVILLHDLQGKRQDWGRLPEKLQEAGYAVLAFDFRGHGESTTVEPQEYWRLNPPRRALAKPPTKISIKDPEFQTALDYAKLGNDLMEAKRFLNLGSDNNEYNSNSMCLIGADEGAVLAVLWTKHGLTAQEQRVIDGTPQGKRAGPRQRQDGKPEGEDVSCIVCLSMRAFLGRDNLEPLLKNGMETLSSRGICTLVLYGEQDKNAAGFGRRAFAWVKSNEYSAEKRIEKTNLTGTKLLGQDALKTDTYILDYLKKAEVWRNPTAMKKDKQELQQSLFAVEQVMSGR